MKKYISLFAGLSLTAVFFSAHAAPEAVNCPQYVNANQTSFTDSLNVTWTNATPSTKTDSLEFTQAFALGKNPTTQYTYCSYAYKGILPPYETFHAGRGYLPDTSNPPPQPGFWSPLGLGYSCSLNAIQCPFMTPAVH